MKNLGLSRLQVFAGLATVLGSLFYVIVLIKYGTSRNADDILYIITLLGFASIFPQIFWGAFLPHYINGDIHQRVGIKNYILKVNFLFIFSAGSIIFLSKFYLNINGVYVEPMFFYLIVAQTLNDALKKISMAEQKIEVAYFSDIINWMSVVFCIYFLPSNFSPFIPLFIGGAVSVIFLFFFISDVLLNFSTNKKNRNHGLLKESMMLKAGSFAYLFKDTIIASILTDGGAGVYSTYSYASKAVTMIFSSIVTPQIEKEGNIIGIEKKYKNIKIFLASIISHVATKFFILHLIAIFSIYCGLNLGWQRILNTSVDFYKVMEVYVILIPLSMLYACEHSMNKYCQATRSYSMLNVTNIICLCFYVGVWILYSVLSMAWIYVFVAMYLIHTILILIFLGKNQRGGLNAAE